MKNKKLFYTFMFLPLIASCIALLFLPDLIPTHYNIKNNVDRWGSKYEILILPIVTIIFGQFLLLMGRIANKQEKQGNNNERNSVVIGTCSLIIFNAISGAMIYSGITKTEKLSFMSLEFEQILFFISGVIFVIIGNVMPKLKKNSALGFRTKHSMKNDETWKKSQRFAGITTILSGIMISIFSFSFHHLTLYILIASIMLLALTINIIYSYKVSK